MIEERKRRLAAEGLFDAAKKRRLPHLPDVIGVITSPTGAVIRDIMHRIGDRFPRRVLLWPVAVQGERAAHEIAAALRGFDRMAAGGRLPRPDVIIVARGGGSVEDLMAFSEEVVLRAVAACTIPVISGVGHETDTTLIDLVADVRAPTPTAAAELAVPVLRELVQLVSDRGGRLLRASSRGLAERQRNLAALSRALPRPASLFGFARQRLDTASDNLEGALSRNTQRLITRLTRASSVLRPRVLRDAVAREQKMLATLDARLTRAYRQRIGVGARQLHAASRVLESVSYRAVLERGFALVRGAKDELRRRASEVGQGERLTVTFADGEVKATSDGKTTRRGPPKPGQGELF
jgi:exodeoxyribonuclease VII large subunit